MKGAIHQPHYFPWIGYFDKMAKADRFIIMNEVQLEDKSYMCRNRFVSRDGELIYLTVTCSKKGYRDKKYKDIEIMDCQKWQNKHWDYFKSTYKYNPFLKEILEHIEPIFSKNYEYLYEVTFDSIMAIKNLLNIPTEIVMQSDLDCKNEKNAEGNKDSRRSGDVLALCLAAQIDEYFTGSGASLSFIDSEEFKRENVSVFVQDYCPIVYQQRFTSEFKGNISALDFLLNCGIEAARDMFWENIKNENDYILDEKVVKK